MLFTPKKYGKSWTTFLAVSFCIGALGFAFSALAAAVGLLHLSDTWDRLFTVLIFTGGTVAFGAVGIDQLRAARRMGRTRT